MATTGDPEAQKYDATQDLPVAEHQNNAIQNPDVDAAQTDANEEEPVGGVMDSASRMEKQKSTNKERTKSEEVQELVNFVLFSIFVPIILTLFAAISIRYTAASNDQSQVANQIALLALCYSNSSGNFCADLLAQTDLYLSEIANKLYYLEPTSGTGRSQSIARITPESTANITYTVSLKDSAAGSAEFKLLLHTVTPFMSLVVLYGMHMFFVNIRELLRKNRRVGPKLAEDVSTGDRVSHATV